MQIPGICKLGGQLVARVPGEELEKVFYEATKLCPSGCSQQCSVRIGGAQSCTIDLFDEELRSANLPLTGA
jgi:hypothetical protein